MSERSYYVYGLWAPGAFEPDQIRYVGKGSGKRAFDYPSRRTKRLKAWIAEIGEEPLFDIIAANLTRDEAFALEIETIAKYGRECDGGTLLNVTTGGAGAPGNKHTAEARARMSAALKGKPKSPEYVEKMRGRAPTAAIGAAADLHRGKPLSDSHRAALSAAHRGLKHSPEHVEKIAAFHTGRRRSAETCAAISAAITGRILSDSHRAAISVVQRGRPHSSEHVEKVAAANRGRKRSSEICATISASRKAYFAAKRAAMEIAA
jgi:NUMOD3 motif